ncbi:hypothetical protein F441_14536 [Phytophthora nicotianae CJ01A1]|uniref:Uncharacterized protein n=6 Tax=Phytophthora nicotianae TaxID=4792 RepID=W2PU41_PHYN3|nr:hypothetical protein PPTG_23613 [Phytophthora nicotianae INRA-310]ETI39751.1 hypothetical protein F443_14676 [Phytophthora nicotianae P1569]ETK79929.1 hypothetical protein L915_14297 [Phytophthora nicotianae]ETO68492.1 hypothetical protein F444_14682 [Phytophthora nicotianae P1976]ETP09658.1 hypothetical protein F441_14536 [Phytophthora nicotianae CJ01A1]ETP37725.1 hypothetical protein F442_14496 [Phytophthora nicotianae P10297]
MAGDSRKERHLEDRKSASLSCAAAKCWLRRSSQTECLAGYAFSFLVVATFSSREIFEPQIRLRLNKNFSGAIFFACIFLRLRAPPGRWHGDPDSFPAIAKPA